MLQLTIDFKNRVFSALTEARKHFDGSDTAFSKKMGINNAVWSRINKGEREKLLSDGQFLTLGRELDVQLKERKWNVARTDVFNIIEEDILFCKNFSKSRICVDDCGIGKTFTAKYLSRTLDNCFYIDASQAKTKQLFIRLLAKTVGVDSQGKYSDVKANFKYYIKMLTAPIIIIDEAGDLEYSAFLELKEFWNATEGSCGWYMMGADGLRAKITMGIYHKKEGYKEMFSRYSERYTTLVPIDKNEKQKFYRKLITDVLSVNMDDKKNLDAIVKRCLTSGDDSIGGLRRAESLLILNS